MYIHRKKRTFAKYDFAGIKMEQSSHLQESIKTRFKCNLHHKLMLNDS